MKRPFSLSFRPVTGNGKSIPCQLDIPCLDGLQIVVSSETARLSDLVPAAREITDIICTSLIEEVNRQGEEIACRKGCSACCRFLAPVSTAEAVHVAEEILSLPSNQRTAVFQACLDGAKLLLAAEPATDCSPSGLSEWYSELNMSCPLLSNNICMMYNSRPIACREHLVSGSVCSSCRETEMRKVEMPVSVTCALADTAARLEGVESEAVMLPLSLPWYETNAVRAMRKWPAMLLAERFAEAMVQRQATHVAEQ